MPSHFQFQLVNKLSTPFLCCLFVDASDTSTLAKTGESATAADRTIQQIKDSEFCKLKPDSATCKSAGDAPVAETIPTSSPAFNISSVSFGSSASCPAPISFAMVIPPFMNRTFEISYTPLCDLMSTLRPLFLALGAIAAAIIFAAGVML